MKKVSIIFLCLCLCLWACNTEEKKEKKEVEVPVSALVLQDDIVKLEYVDYGLDAKAKSDIESLESFMELETIMAELKSGNLSYFQGQSKPIVSLMKDLREGIPDIIDSPSIQARLISLETKMLKLQSVLNLRNIEKDVQLEYVKEALVAYSNLNLQINKKYEKDAQEIEKP
ncbi:hypothetical protein [Formosa algae]|uniref:Uncharacterized protein n=1 Tax=Formosa algae TaxID=225843 RepID=A0A9X0YP60_9FLAO|nr:hypothetical protein [Formosa algae]MBP1840458.1 hypothetical protein [Formosa algae]MDQ0336950.1 hypothetical protein [Formosa algae]OEI80836.1 hypothetical protein AST99_07235 [Formosa algae]